MKKIIGALATGTLVVALALTLAGSAHAQVASTTSGTGYTMTSTSTTGTTDTSGTNSTSGSSATTGTTGSTTSPGLPNTGAGGDATMNVAVLLSSGLIAVGGAVLVARKLAV